MKTANGNTLKIKWIVVAIYLALITYLSLGSPDTLRTSLFNIPHRDKIAHFFMYGFLVIVLRWAMDGSEFSKSKRILILVAPIGYGIMIEFVQLIFAYFGRSFEVGDIIANTCGACFCWLFCEQLFQFKSNAIRQ